MAETQIEWTDATWSPVAGCSIVTAGCTHCYAMEIARRLEAMGVEKYAGLTRKTGKRTVWNGVPNRTTSQSGQDMRDEYIDRLIEAANSREAANLHAQVGTDVADGGYELIAGRGADAPRTLRRPTRRGPGPGRRVADFSFKASSVRSRRCGSRHMHTCWWQRHTRRQIRYQRDCIPGA